MRRLKPPSWVRNSNESSPSKKPKNSLMWLLWWKKHKLNGTTLDKGTSGLKNVSLTKEHWLPSHVLVRDVITGMGPTVKLGQKVLILYEASFPTGRVFDKNKNQNNPLAFWLGTGEVIWGLKKGLEGMKVGGEWEITTPPELGYSKEEGPCSIEHYCWEWCQQVSWAVIRLKLQGFPSTPHAIDPLPVLLSSFVPKFCSWNDINLGFPGEHIKFFHHIPLTLYIILFLIYCNVQKIWIQNGTHHQAQ